MRTAQRTGTLVFTDGTKVEWEFVEHVPYEPACYQHESGILVWVPSFPGSEDQGNTYFISLDTGAVYGAQDDDEDSITKELPGVHDPEITRQVEQWDKLMSSYEEM